jgi:multidrug efflux pump subunit AcrA (membrane-fusion protein)
LRAEVADAYVTRIQAGPARVIVPAAGERSFVGEVVGIAPVQPSAGRGPRTEAPARYHVRVVVDDGAGTLKAGLSATVELPMSSPAGALRVPTVAVDRTRLADGGRETAVVWTARGAGPPTPIPVEIGVGNGEYTEVRGPEIRAGTAVVLHERPR